AILLAAGYGADDDGLDWGALARTGQPIVLYMAMRNLANIADQLMHGGLPPRTPVAVVVSATTADERIVVSTLDRVAADAQMNQLGTPSIIVIGDIVKLREGLADSTRALASEPASGRQAASLLPRRIPARARPPSRWAFLRRSSARVSPCARRKRGPTTSIRRFIPSSPKLKPSTSTVGRCRRHSWTRSS